MTDLHVATVNVRYDGRASDPVPIPSSGPVPPQSGSKDYTELPWAERRSRLVDCLLSSGPLDIIGFQEVLHSQLHDLQALLGDTYSHVGVGRDDGQTAGEYSPIFYDKTQYEQVDWRTVWLSKTPDVPGSKDWDASQTRIVTLLTLRRKFNPGLIHVANTHYDDGGKVSRAESSYIIREQAYAFFSEVERAQRTEKSIPTAVVLLGDFSEFAASSFLLSRPRADQADSPSDEAGYANIISTDPLPSGRPGYTFTDSYTHLQARCGSEGGPRQSAPYGPVDTYTTFGKPGARGTGRIDFIFVGHPPDDSDEREISEKGLRLSPWSATTYACLDNHVEKDATGWMGRWSDHRAVRVKLELTG